MNEVRAATTPTNSQRRHFAPRDATKYTGRTFWGEVIAGTLKFACPCDDVVWGGMTAKSFVKGRIGAAGTPRTVPGAGRLDQVGQLVFRKGLWERCTAIVKVLHIANDHATLQEGGLTEGISVLGVVAGQVKEHATEIGAGVGREIFIPRGVFPPTACQLFRAGNLQRRLFLVPYSL